MWESIASVMLGIAALFALVILLGTNGWGQLGPVGRGLIGGDDVDDRHGNKANDD